MKRSLKPMKRRWPTQSPGTAAPDSRQAQRHRTRLHRGAQRLRRSSVEHPARQASDRSGQLPSRPVRGQCAASNSAFQSSSGAELAGLVSNGNRSANAGRKSVSHTAVGSYSAKNGRPT
jgi:hypothetical protein